MKVLIKEVISKNMAFDIIPDWLFYLVIVSVIVFGIVALAVMVFNRMEIKSNANLPKKDVERAAFLAATRPKPKLKGMK